MAHKKAGGSTTNVKDSRGQRLGIKLFGGQKVKTGQIILRQRGTKFHPGINVKRSKDDTLHALVDGLIEFKKKKARRFTGKLKSTTFVNVVSSDVDSK